MKSWSVTLALVAPASIGDTRDLIAKGWSEVS
jgi:hypothetical protein